MAKPKQTGKRLYVARLQGGNTHAEWPQFYNNLAHQNGKSPDYGGINNVAVFATHHDLVTARMLCAEDISDETSLEVSEITANTLAAEHYLYRQLVRDYFLPYGTYPAIGKTVPD